MAITTEMLLEVDPDEVAEKFNRQAFAIRHALAGHALFQLSALVELSRSLPENCVEFNLGTLPLSLDPQATPRNGLSVSQTIKQIETCDSWMALKKVQVSEPYNTLLDSCLDEVNKITERQAGAMFDRLGFIFVSSPHAVTPFHIDPENNFLLQIRGNKTLYVFDKEHRGLLREDDLEKFYSGGHRNLVLDDRLKGVAERFDLRPGDGLHIPQHAPHYVVNGDDVSVSFSITFNTAESDRARGVYWFNHKLRKLNLKPNPPGHSPMRDRAKFACFQALRLAKRVTMGKGKG